MVGHEIAERLAAVRERMQRDGLDFYLVPSSDDHQNEYVPACWQRRLFISGFSGSAGDVLIGRERAWLWTDSRYHLQAEAQLDPALYALQRSGNPDVSSLEDWLAQQEQGCIVGVDPRVITLASAKKLREALRERGGSLRAVEENYVDAVWIDPPPAPAAPARVLDVAYAGLSVAEKLAAIRDALAERECQVLVLSRLDAIAWTFNLRGADIAYNPLLVSYALVGAGDAVLFAAPQKLTPEVRAHLGEAGVRAEPYEFFGEALSKLSGRVWLDPRGASLWVAERLEASGARVVEAASPVSLLKARKNPVEIEGMRAAHARDGVAVVRFLHWLEEAWQAEELDELAAARRLDALRAEGEHFQGPSFPTISAFAGSGAIVHYGATPESTRRIDDSSLYLVDSGAQYLDGTTDVTRTVHLGEPTREQREHYTRVLRGHLALRHAIFPTGTAGARLDAFARRPLWDVGLDFGHGVGHGVGCYLNVHEGPQAISPRATEAGLEPGMVVSNEPGLYLAGRYGIRIENLLLIVEVKSAEETGAVPFLGFEDLTLVPYCRKLIDPELLDARELEAVNAYQSQVFAALGDRVPAAVRGWLARETAPLGSPSRT